MTDNTGSALRFKAILPWAALGLVLGILLLVFGAGIGLFTRGSPSVQLEPVMTIIPLPSATPITPSPSPSPTPDWTATPVPPPQLEGTFAIGDLVSIFGTGGDGLRLRNQPGLGSSIAFLGVESEVFEVKSGPNESDGYEWWYLVNPYNEEKAGWAVANYLRRADSP
jgi:hypothetical protein